MNNTPKTPSPNLITGIYWRKNLWNGAATVPVVFSLWNGVLKAKTKSESVFEVSISDAIVSFSVWGTMTVLVDGKKYDFTGVGSGLSAPFSEEQQKEIESSGINTPTNVAKAGAVGAIVGGVTGGLSGGATQATGAAAMTTGYFMGLEAIKEWQEIFTKIGVLSSKSNKNFKRSAALMLGAIILAVLALVAIATAIL